MKRIKYIFYIVVLILFFSCESKTKYKKPENLIPKDQMIDLLTEMHLVAGANNINNKNLEKNLNYMSLVFEKYKVDSVQFNANNVYYTSNIDEYEKMFEEVERRLKKLQDSYQNKTDSLIRIKTDSLKYLNKIPKMKGALKGKMLD